VEFEKWIIEEEEKFVMSLLEDEISDRRSKQQIIELDILSEIEQMQRYSSFLICLPFILYLTTVTQQTSRTSTIGARPD